MVLITRKNGGGGGGGGGSSTRGSITGTLSDQTDLQTALDGKITSVVAGTGIVVDSTDTANPVVSVDPNLLTSSITFYSTTASSDISGYSKLVTSIEDVDYDEPAVNVPTGAITGTDQLVGELATAPGLFVGNPGIITITTIGEIRKTSGGSSNAQFYFKVFHRDGVGTETEIAVSNPTMAITNTVYGQFNTSALLNNGAFDITDRVVIKYYATKIGGGTNPTYEFMFGGTNPVRTLFPLPTEILLTDYYTKSETDTLLSSKADLVAGKVPSSQLPSFVDDVVEVANFASLPVTGETGKIYITLDTNKTYRWSGSIYIEISAGVTDHTLLTNIGTNTHAQIDTHIANTSNPHSVTKTQVGLGNVDNTSDLNKPISTATQTALDDKWSKTGNTGTNPATNFIGTTDAQPLVVKTNNVERMRVLSGGNVGIGTTTPAYKLDINAGSTVGILQRITTTATNGYLTLTAGTRTVRFGADSEIGPHFGSTTKGGFAFLDNFSCIPLQALAVNNGGNDMGQSAYRFNTFYGKQINVNGTGNNYLAGNITTDSDIEITDTTKGVILKSANGTRWRVTVNNTGALTTTAL